jgi:serine/threonine protein kinase
LHHLHSHGFIHRDIKPSNCLLHVHTIGRRPRVLLSDFGEVQVSSASRMGTGATGTVSYCAPEVLRPADPGGTGFGNFSVKSDVFSVGMMVHFMCFGALPYSSAEAINADDEDVEALRAEIVAWRGFDAAAAPARGGRLDLPDRLYSFLKTLLALDPDDRPSTEDILRGIGAGIAGADEDELAPQFAGRDTRNPRAANPSFAPPGATRHSSPSKSPLRTHRHHTHVHAVEDGELDFEDDEPRSSKEPGTDDAAATAVVRRRPRTGSNHNHGSTSPRPPALPPNPAPPHSPILALPPPPATLRQRLRAALLPPHAAAQQQPLLRLALFAAKYLSLTAPCAPLAPRPRLAYPLLVLAAAEAVLRVPWRWAAAALAVHVAALAVVGGSGAGLCAWGVGGM